MADQGGKYLSYRFEIMLIPVSNRSMNLDSVSFPGFLLHQRTRRRLYVA